MNLQQSYLQSRSISTFHRSYRGGKDIRY